MFTKHRPNFYGTGTVGEKGQIVIPAKAREDLSIKPEDKFIFFGHGPVLHMVRADQIDNWLAKITSHFTQEVSRFKKETKSSS